ncbi:unnamed protein product (mitochondrion) [Plasmodiophora brassicae]|uniref:C3H1-type domain-containing protein n=1 Tax=Plasmodiophora brassicae TaxID=37360 RepID=A0A3P3YQ05_PLABS|nr:unnamed protein product [Plasmodiophora brassicae]
MGDDEPQADHRDAGAVEPSDPATEAPAPAESEPVGDGSAEDVPHVAASDDAVVTQTTGAKRRWARKQAEDVPTSKYQRAESQQGEYNIWYHRYLGDQQRVRERATTRPDTYICLYFAKGNCVQGRKCNFLHRLPTADDDARLDIMHDVFGRKRHQTDREDMGGIGCFSKECKTLYIGNIPIDAIPDTYAKLAKHFGVFGPIEQINVKPKHGCCFVRFVYRASAEFAKVAMAEQALDGEEQLNVRWAYEDPNPRVIKQVQAEKEQRVVDALRNAGYSQDMARYNAPASYRPSGPQQQQGAYPADPYAYPDTSGQYAGDAYQDPYNQAYAQYYYQYAGAQAQAQAAAPAQHAQAPRRPAAPPAVDKHTPMTREMYLAQLNGASRK